jgi:hypothetical protein
MFQSVPLNNNFHHSVTKDDNDNIFFGCNKQELENLLKEENQER